MIDIQKRALRSFKKDVFALAGCLVQIDNGVRDERLNRISGSAITFVNLFEGKRAGANGFEDFVVLPNL